MAAGSSSCSIDCCTRILFNELHCVKVSYNLSDFLLRIDVRKFGDSGFAEDEKLKIIDEFTKYFHEHEEKLREIKKLVFGKYLEFMITPTSKLFKFVHYVVINISPYMSAVEDVDRDLMSVVDIPQCKILKLVCSDPRSCKKLLHLIEFIPLSVENLVINTLQATDLLLLLNFFNMPPCVKTITIENYTDSLSASKMKAIRKQITDSFRKNGLDEECKIIFDNWGEL